MQCMFSVYQIEATSKNGPYSVNDQWYGEITWLSPGWNTCAFCVVVKRHCQKRKSKCRFKLDMLVWWFGVCNIGQLMQNNFNFYKNLICCLEFWYQNSSIMSRFWVSHNKFGTSWAFHITSFVDTTMCNIYYIISMNLMCCLEFLSP